MAGPEAVADGAGVRRDEQVRGFPERVGGGERFGVGDVESGTGDFFLLKSGEQRGLIEQGASRDIDEMGRGFHPGKLGCAEEVFCLASLGRADDHEVGVRQDIVELGDGDDFFGERGIAFAGARDAPDAHVEGFCAAGEFVADGAVTHDEKHLAI